MTWSLLRRWDRWRFEKQERKLLEQLASLDRRIEETKKELGETDARISSLEGEKARLTGKPYLRRVK